MEPWAGKRPTVRRRTAVLVVALAGVLHVSYLTSLGLHVAAGLPGRTRIDLLFRDAAFGVGAGCDFFQFYRAGEDLRAGRDFFRDLGTPSPPSEAPYAYNWVRYPPWLAYVIGLPATLVSPVTAYLAWCVAIELAWATSLVMLWRRCRDDVTRTTLLVLFLVWSPQYLELFMGQTSTIMGAMLLMLVLSAVDERRKAEAGWLAATMAFKYQTVWLAPYYLKVRRMRPYLVAVAIGAASSVPYFLWHPAAFTVFLKWTFPRTSEQIFYQGNFGIAALQAYLINDYALGPHRALAVAVIAGAAVRTFTTPTVDPLRGITLWTLAMFLAQIAAYEHHYNLLLPILSLSYVETKSRPLLLALGVLAAPTPFYLFSSVWRGYSAVEHGVDALAGAVTISFKVLPVAAIYVGLLWRGIGTVGDPSPLRAPS
jgi:hypothetical protein